MSTLLKAGELMWTSEGTHVWDDKGTALRCVEDTEVVFVTAEIEAQSLKFIHADREFRGCDPISGEMLQIAEEEVLQSEVEGVL
jgi:hypothetical protein